MDLRYGNKEREGIEREKGGRKQGYLLENTKKKKNKKTVGKKRTISKTNVHKVKNGVFRKRNVKERNHTEG